MKSLPKDPEKFVNAVENIIEKATPKKLELLKQKQLLNTPQSKKKLSFYEQSSQVLKESFPARRSDKVKKTIIKNLAFLKKYRLSRTLAKFLGVSNSCVSKHINLLSAEKPKQPRKDATTTTDKSTITFFSKELMFPQVYQQPKESKRI